MRWKAGVLVASLLFGACAALPTTNAVAATTWPVAVDVAPSWIEAVGDNKLSILDCYRSYYEGRVGTPGQSFWLDGVRKPSSTYVGGSGKYLPWSNGCSPDSTVSTADGTFYTGVYRGGNYDASSQPDAIVKEKNGRFMWTTTILMCPSKEYKYGYVVAMEMGASGRLSVVLRSGAHYDDCPDRFAVIDTMSGKPVIPPVPLSSGGGYVQPRLSTYSSGEVVLDRAGLVHYFDVNGKETGAADSSFAGVRAPSRVWADSARNLYSYTPNSSSCYSQQSVRRLTPGKPATVLYTFPVDNSCFVENLAPLAGGAVAVLEQSQTSVQLTRYSTGTPVTLNATVPSGYSEWPVRVDGDTNGNALYITRRYRAVGGSYTTSIVIRLANFTTKSITEIWNGRTAISGGGDMDSIAAGDIYGGYLYLPLCRHDCGNNSLAAKIYKIALPGFGAKYQSSGSFAPLTASTKRKYVAMGDSFVSGEGNPRFDRQTDISQGGSNNCHRSPVAYPKLLTADSSMNLELVDFVACSGATTTDLLNGSSGGEGRNEPAQINALSSDTDVITLTIGGNDVKFKEFATACALNSCGINSSAYITSINKIRSELPGKLLTVYRKITERAPKAQVYVVGYPQIAPKQMPTGANSACWPLNGGSNSDTKTGGGPAAYSIVSELNATLRTQVNAMNATSDPDYFHFVSPDEPNSPFIGHDWCSQSRYFGIIAFNNTEYSFHPTGSGHGAYKTIVKEKMK